MRYSLQSNWKVVVDNYVDGGYHVPFAHKGLSASLDLATYETAVHDGFSVQSVALSGSQVLRLAGGSLS